MPTYRVIQICCGKRKFMGEIVAPGCDGAAGKFAGKGSVWFENRCGAKTTYVSRHDSATFYEVEKMPNQPKQQELIDGAGI